MADNKVRSAIIPVDASELLLGTLGYDSGLGSIVELDDTVGFSIFDKMRNAKELFNIVIVG